MTLHEDTIYKMLPKKYNRRYVSREIQIATIFFKNLTPFMDDYVHNNGTIKNLVSLTGTIPVRFSGKIYNIPICLWIDEKYPQVAPICYVRPTREMMIVKGKHVHTNGKIKLPYLKEWKKGECDLVTLLQIMAAMFGESPPVCMRSCSEYEETLCSVQFRKQTNEDLYMSLSMEDGLPFQQENETTC